MVGSGIATASLPNYQTPLATLPEVVPFEAKIQAAWQRGTPVTKREGLRPLGTSGAGIAERLGTGCDCRCFHNRASPATRRGLADTTAHRSAI